MKKFRFISFLLGIYILFSILSESNSKFVRYPEEFLNKVFGIVYVFVPVTLIHLSLKRKKSKLPVSLLALRWAIFYLLAVSFIEIIGREIYGVALAGGMLGKWLLEILYVNFKPFGSFLLILFFITLFFLHIYNIGFMDAIKYIYKRIKYDIDEFRTYKPVANKTFPLDLKPVKIEIPASEVPVKKVEPPAVKEVTTPSIKTEASESKTIKSSYFLDADLLNDYEAPLNNEDINSTAQKLLSTLESYGLKLKLKDIDGGPQFTRFNLELPAGVRVSEVYQLSNEIAIALKVPKIRITAVPAKEALGIEVPNKKISIVGLKSVIGAAMNLKKPLALSAGVDVLGNPYIFDLSEQPHLLIAGATGSGKSILMHSLLLTLLFKNPPQKLKVILIDPKKIEFPQYNGIPHLYDPVSEPSSSMCIVDPVHALKTLNALIDVMEERYELLSKKGARDISGYQGDDMFYIVVFVDELADLVIQTRRAVEECIQRLSQLSRAVGIHLIISTQRPSVDVITGVIKANLPARIALKCSSQTDSRVIIDTPGAETLQGKGDMLFIPVGSSVPVRLQSPYVSQKEVLRIVEYLKKFGSPSYTVSEKIKKKYFTSKPKDTNKLFELYSSKGLDIDEERISMLIRAFKLIRTRQRVSHDLLKAEFGASSTASDILSLLEIGGFIYKQSGSNKWEIDYAKISDFV